MGLFTALSLGASAIRSQQTALDTVGQNISNANTEGYSRQRVEFENLPPTRFGNLFVGNGVNIADVRRVFDQQVENRLQQALSTLGSLGRQNDVYNQLEQAINALGDDPANGVTASVGAQLDEFFGQLNALSSDPSSNALRQVFVSQGEALTYTISKLAEDVNDLRESYNSSVVDAVRNVNQYAKEIAQLNDKIVKAEVGGQLTGEANDLRDRRDLMLRKLSEMVDIDAVEGKTGAVDVRVAGTFLVSGDDYFTLETNIVPDQGIDIAEVEYQITGSAFSPREGELGGLLMARDDILPSFLDDLNLIARTLIQTFNEIHSQGQGVNGLKEVTSDPFTATNALNAQLPISIAGTVNRGNDAGTFLVDPNLRNFPNGQSDPEHFVGAKVLFTSGANEGHSSTILRYDPASGRLDLNPPQSHPIDAGDGFEITSLDFPIRNGSFKLNVRNDVSGVTDVFDIELDRDGLPNPPHLDDTTLQDLVTDINTQLDSFYGGIPPVVARIDEDYRLRIESIESDTTFSFSDDTSGFLAAAGINTFFKGRDAYTIGVKEEILDDVSLLATGMSAAPGDNGNVQRMLGMRDEKLFVNGSSTLSEYYQGVIGTVAVETATARELATNQAKIAESAMNARERISGVNIDEEAIDLIKFQRSFQAAARYLGVVDQLLAELMNIV